MKNVPDTHPKEVTRRTDMTSGDETVAQSPAHELLEDLDTDILPG
ncbi:hypothetical protein [Corynebacterium sp. CCM 9203]